MFDRAYQSTYVHIQLTTSIKTGEKTQKYFSTLFLIHNSLLTNVFIYYLKNREEFLKNKKFAIRWYACSV